MGDVSELVEDGARATELGQCPYKPGTPDWKLWQHRFSKAQCVDPVRAEAGLHAAHARAAAAGMKLDWRGNLTPLSPAPVSDVARRAAEALAEADEFDRRARMAARPWRRVQIDDPVTGVVVDDDEDRIFVYSGAQWVSWAPASAVASVSFTVQAMSDAFGQLAAVCQPAVEDEVRTIRGRPAGRVRECHHGRAKGACRECSRQSGRRR